MPYGTEVLLQKVTYCPLSSPDKSPLLPYIHHSHTVLNEKKQKKKILLKEVQSSYFMMLPSAGFSTVQ